MLVDIKFYSFVLFVYLWTSVPCVTTQKHGSLVWMERFDFFDLDVWDHLVTAWGGGNDEFQYYRNNRRNSFVKDGVLHITPTLTADEFNETDIYSGSMREDGCNMEPCESRASFAEIIKPVYSARIRTKNSFSFKYGRVEVRAKMPRGDWLWPAIWFLPVNSSIYGTWPAGGEIDLVETRGNKNLSSHDGRLHGVNEFSSTLHFGPYAPHNGFQRTNFIRHFQDVDLSDDFHTWEMEWSNESISFHFDDQFVGRVEPPEDGGFWKLGGFDKHPGGNNPWKDGEIMAPFDQEFFIIINLAVGGRFFPDGWVNSPHRRPWEWSSGRPMRQFYEARDQWMPTWDRPTLLVDHILVYSN